MTMIDALPGDIFHQGQVLNNTYEIEGVLGRGGTGEVYRARNLISQRIVAIKALNARFSGNDDYIELMKREEQMRDIRDDAVVRYTECSRSDQGHVFVVMDFMDGPSMADVMAHRRMEPRDLMIIAHRVAQGLVAAHGQGIVHRDLSPDNVILRGDSPERATIIDFGIAKDTAAGARTIVGNDFAGKYEYAAPEQLEGRAEARSDLYALGALLLAAFRGQVPFAGATPGEMIRRKQAPLDTVGVPEPLKGLVDWLTTPGLAERAPSAKAVVAKLDLALKPVTSRDRTVPDQQGKKGGGGLKWLALPVMLALAGGGAYVSGALDRFLVEPLPVANPYTLTATGGTAAQATLQGFAPDDVTGAALVAAFAAATGAAEGAATITLAQGMPTDGWATAAAAVFPALAGLEQWQVALTDLTAKVTGKAPDAAAKTVAEAQLQDWATAAGITLTLAVAVPEVKVTVAQITQTLAEMANCGPLTPTGATGDDFPPGATIRITGNVSETARADAIRDFVQGLAPGRKVEVDVRSLNPEICAVRKVLPQVGTADMSIWFGDGKTGQANVTGVFTTGQNPVVDLMLPATITQGALWVTVVDNSGKVFNLIPGLNNEETDISKLGTVENGVRRIRILYPTKENAGEGGQQGLATVVDATNYGKTEFLVFLSPVQLFPTRRPTDESIDAFAEGLAALQAEKPQLITAVASRILDARP